MNNNDKRLIEVAFPLKETSIDSVHEKNVRHGHISTLHIWPARRPLAASRAALIATLLPDPGDKEKRDELLKRIGGTLRKTLKKKTLPNGQTEEIEAWATEGGVLAWGRENGPAMDWFRSEIRKAYGGRPPKVLDPFAGGGAIPLEALRLGCEVTAADINPVAWFILRCTLDYPQKLAALAFPLPDFVLADADFMRTYLRAKGMASAQIERHLSHLESTQSSPPPDHAMETVARGESLSLLEQPELNPELLKTGLAWHVRAWGRRVLREARRDLARLYPVYAEFCTLTPYRRVDLDSGTTLKLVPVDDGGAPQVDLLNAGFDSAYLENPANPRWIAKPTTAYLWARTVKCKACRAELPLLKTRWLAKKNEKRVILTMTPNTEKSGVHFGIDSEVKLPRGNAAHRREFDKRIGAGTMSRTGATCPCCGTIMTMEDLRLEGRAGRLGARISAVAVEAPAGKEFRLPTQAELDACTIAEHELGSLFESVPFGLPTEPLAGAEAPGFRVPLYGLDRWDKLYTHRQLMAVGRLVLSIRQLRQHLGTNVAYSNGIQALLAIALDRTANYLSTICIWESKAQEVKQTFLRYAFPITWDFAEGNPLAPNDRFFNGALSNVASAVESLTSEVFRDAPSATVLNQSAIDMVGEQDIVVTDPPYYDAIPYSDLMDFFYVWLRRTLYGLSPELTAAFREPLAPKWDHEKGDGELIDDASRFGGSKEASKRNYEQGMARAFSSCHRALGASGRLVIVFAHKQPDAWETLVTAIIKAGFVVDGSWPIATEMQGGIRNHGRASLASSVWLVCRKRDPLARAGWDTQVLKEMESSITTKLRDFWDAGIRGPDFVWAATGPALESYSRYPAVKRASEPGALMSVTDFLGHVRRIVVDFVVGRVLSHGRSEPTPGDHPLDDATTYYLLHRNDFGLKEAPAGPCILYAVSCGLTERELADQYELLARTGGADNVEDDEPSDGAEDDEAEEAAPSGAGGKYKLKDWRARKHRSLGMETTSGRAIPLIDQVHKLMQLWVGGDVVNVNDYLDRRALRRSQVFAQLIQALIEKSRTEGSVEECSILERLQNYLRSLGSTAQAPLGLE